MHATHEAELDFPALPLAARSVKLVPNLASGTLVSVGQLCDNGCQALFDKRSVTIFYDNRPVLHGTRPGSRSLWTLTPSTLTSIPPTLAFANAARPAFLPSSTLAANIVAFMHAALGSPVLSTLQKALDSGFLPGIPGLTSQSLRNNPPFSVATVKGHQDALRQGLQSTQPATETDNETTDSFPDSDTPNTRAHDVLAAFADISGKAFSDLTGNFDVPSSRGNKCVLVLYDYDSNYIFAAPIPSTKSKAVAEAHDRMFATLTAAGLKPKLLLLDNAASKVLKQYLTSSSMDFQLVPPHNHRRNAAERAIRTWKNHFIAILAAADDGFPLHLWDMLVPQANITLNLLRGSRINPNLSAYAQIHGFFDYNRTPLAPPGTRVLAHEPKDVRGSWAVHASEGWYVGPALDSYRCFTIWIDHTRRTRLVERVTWFPTRVHVPVPTTAELISATLDALRATLANPPDLHSLLPLGPQRLDLLTQLSQVLSNSEGEAEAQPPQAVPPIAQAFFSNHLFDQCYKATHPDTNVLSEYKDLRTSSEGARWELACAKEIGRLTQGLPPHYPNGRNTFRFVAKSDVPRDATVTYLRIVASYRPQKEDPYRVRFTVGGDRLTYDGETYTNTSNLTTFKIAINAVLSTPNCRACAIDLSDFYLMTRLDTPEYMRIHASLLPQIIIDYYKLDVLIAHDGYVYVRIDGGMYGLKQAGRIANETLVKRLAEHGFIQCRHTPGLFRHETRPLFFTLIVDDFFVGYSCQEDVDLLLSCLRLHYDTKVDWDASLYSGIHMVWDYDARTCDISMPNYVSKALQRFEHEQPARPQHAPHPWTPPVYGAKTQYTPLADVSPVVPPAQRTRIMEIIGTLLFYARAIDNTMLVALNALASQQATPTQTTMDHIVHLLNYAATYPDATVRFRASAMVLWVHSDASYLSEPPTKSRYGGFFYLSDQPPAAGPKTGDAQPTLNGPILAVTHILKEVVASAAEAELGALYNNSREAAPLRITLEELGFPQPPTPIQVDNTTAAGLANGTVKPRRSKAMTMRYFWIQDRVSLSQYFVYWDRGVLNLADYPTKHHPVSHHKAVRPTYLHVPSIP
jgi:hypothetical protein